MEGINTSKTQSIGRQRRQMNDTSWYDLDRNDLDDSCFGQLSNWTHNVYFTCICHLALYGFCTSQFTLWFPSIDSKLNMEKNTKSHQTGHVCECDGSSVRIVGYSYSCSKTVLTFIGYVLTFGFLRIIFHWFPHWRLKCTNTMCNLNEAQKVLIKDSYGVYFIHKVVVETVNGIRDRSINKLKWLKTGGYFRSRMSNFTKDEDFLVYFMHKRMKYIWNCQSQCYELLRGWEERPYREILRTEPLDNEKIIRHRALYGVNVIDISLTPIIKLLINKCLNPFYCFQILSCILWYIENYWMYATCIVVISIISLAWEVYELRTNERSLKNTICNTSTVSVCRDENGKQEFRQVHSIDLVPGDLIEIPRNGCIMQCDALLLVGNCIVNENTLTGESVPVTKTPSPSSQSESEIFDVRSNSRHVLFGGTSVIQTRNYADERVVAVVVRTGFRTVKGELVRSILFPKPMKFKFTQDAFKFIAALSVIAIIGLVISIYFMVTRSVSTFEIVLRALDLITVVIPPALPVAMTVGIVFAQRRLRRSHIYCINPNAINVCGVINVTCFDKTGTLTEDGMDLWGVIPNDNGVFGKPVFEPSDFKNGSLIECMASCHSLTLIEGVLSGDPLDLKMFNSTKWEFIEEASEDYCKFEMAVPAIVRPCCDKSVIKLPNEVNFTTDSLPYEIGILRQFPFTSSLQRMSVIARALNSNHFNVYSKGAPETIELLCRRDTVPSDFHSTLLEYTREGYRVLALAWKPLKLTYTKVLRLPRERVEQDLLFLGLLVMENRLKEETTPVIQTLKQANIRPVMVTGDNMLTAISVARDCEMIDEFDRIILVSAKPPPITHSAITIPAEGDVGHVQTDKSHSHQTHYKSETRPYIEQELLRIASTFRSDFDNKQDDSLVQFHYAEDLHKPVTEVTATTRKVLGRPNAAYKRSQITQKSRKPLRWLRRLRHKEMPPITDPAYSITSSPLTDTSEIPDILVNTNGNSFHRIPIHEKNHVNSCHVSIQMLDRPDFHLAISGKTWSVIKEHYPWLIPKLVVKGTVFARFLPEQKAQLVEALQSVGYFVAMCGDGANDCGALKAAHAGVSLSETEASVASPFTFKKQNISCVPILIREGRCALVTSFGTFKFMIGYSMIQFLSVILLYYIGSNISDAQFLYYDLFLITTLGLTFGYTNAYPRLSVEPPGMRLLSTVTLLSLGLQLLTCAIIQIGTFLFVRAQPWYLPLFSIHDDYELFNYESTSVFIVAVYQYIILALVFSKGAPYRMSVFSNTIFVANIVICFASSLYLTVYPLTALSDLFSLYRLNSLHFVFVLHGAVIANFLLGYILESFVDGVSFRKRIRHIHRALFPRHVSRKDYERIREEIDRLAGAWPPIIRSASVHALPRDLLNEGEADIPKSPRRHHISEMSSDSDDNDSSILSQNAPMLYVRGRFNQDESLDSQHLIGDKQVDTNIFIKGVSYKKSTRKRAHSASSRRRHSFNDGDLGFGSSFPNDSDNLFVGPNEPDNIPVQSLQPKINIVSVCRSPNYSNFNQTGANDSPSHGYFSPRGTGRVRTQSTGPRHPHIYVYNQPQIFQPKTALIPQ